MGSIVSHRFGLLFVTGYLWLIYARVLVPKKQSSEQQVCDDDLLYCSLCEVEEGLELKGFFFIRLFASLGSF